jgi:hypothetical protein
VAGRAKLVNLECPLYLPHPKKRGRPRKPAREKAARVLITMAPRLLAATDAAAGKCGLSRAGLIRQAVLDWLGQKPKSRKSE